MYQHWQKKKKKDHGFTTVALPTCKTDELSPLDMPVVLGDTLQVNSTLQNRFIW